MDTVRSRRSVVTPETVRMPNGGEEMRVSRLSSHEPPIRPPIVEQEAADAFL